MGVRKTKFFMYADCLNRPRVSNLQTIVLETSTPIDHYTTVSVFRFCKCNVMNSINKVYVTIPILSVIARVNKLTLSRSVIVFICYINRLLHSDSVMYNMERYCTSTIYFHIVHDTYNDLFIIQLK